MLIRSSDLFINPPPFRQQSRPQADSDSNGSLDRSSIQITPPNYVAYAGEYRAATYKSPPSGYHELSGIPYDPKPAQVRKQSRYREPFVTQEQYATDKSHVPEQPHTPEQPYMTTVLSPISECPEPTELSPRPFIPVSPASPCSPDIPELPGATDMPCAFELSSIPQLSCKPPVLQHIEPHSPMKFDSPRFKQDPQNSWSPLIETMNELHHFEPSQPTLTSILGYDRAIREKIDCLYTTSSSAMPPYLIARLIELDILEEDEWPDEFADDIEPLDKLDASTGVVRDLGLIISRLCSLVEKQQESDRANRLRDFIASLRNSVE